MESLEEILYTSDLGPGTVQRLVEAVGKALTHSEKSDVQKVREALKAEMMKIFSSLSHKELDEISHILNLNSESQGPQVWMIVGVNGAGKTHDDWQAGSPGGSKWPQGDGCRRGHFSCRSLRTVEGLE